MRSIPNGPPPPALGLVLALGLATIPAVQAQDPASPDVATEPAAGPDLATIRAAGQAIGLDLTPPELELMRAGVADNLGSLQRLRAAPLDNADAPATSFGAWLPGMAPLHVTLPDGVPWPAPDPAWLQRPARLEDLAFADIATLGALLRARAVSCVELTRMFLGRLHRLDATLHCVISFTDERALAQAARLDEELAAGRDRGPLHGIPWGAKDLLSARGARTTWGAKPFEDQVIDVDAEVVRRLDEAGAVLCAKLTLGALAWGDVWFGGTTRNPWNPAQGSSGSSAGPASAVAAGALPFAIGSETLGSIVSPSARCGNTSLRPTFGRVSRRGAMALAWTLDKLGPMARSARDAALVFAAIQGTDPLDETTAPAAGQPFAPPGHVDVSGWRVGYVPGAWRPDAPERVVLEELAALGVQLVPVAFPRFEQRAATPGATPGGGAGGGAGAAATGADDPAEAASLQLASDLLVILAAEAAEAFDELTLDGRDDLLVRQVEQAWPNVFRQARLLPAVEYLRAQRLRRRLMLRTDALMQSVDLLVHPSSDPLLVITNLTGHPTVVAPATFREDGTPRSVSFTGRLFDEARLLGFVEAWQATSAHHLSHPLPATLEQPLELAPDGER